MLFALNTPSISPLPMGRTVSPPEQGGVRGGHNKAVLPRKI